MIFAGEPLLNENVFQMVRYAEDRKIRVLLSTNTTLFDDKKIKELFESNLSYLIVCLDGSRKETHEQYRQGSDFEQVRENIRKICQLKKELGVYRPYIVLQFLVMKQNEQEMNEMIELAKNLGVDRLDFKSLSLGSFIGAEKKTKLAEENLPQNSKYSRFIFKNGFLRAKSKPQICSWMRQMVILWNGDVSMCCYDFNGDLIIGNIFRDGGFKKILKSRKYQEYRKMAIQKKLTLCKNCNFSAETINSIIFNNNR